jgi:hypothetical protein
MKKFILSMFAVILAVGLVSMALGPAFSAPSDHNLKTDQGIKNFWTEQGDRTGGG